MIKKPIRSTHLLLRFYVSDGWTKEELDSCCVRGEVHVPFHKDTEPYYTLKHGSAFNPKKLLDRTSKIHRWAERSIIGDISDEQYIEDMNW